MNTKKIISSNLQKLNHSHHGGEIYNHNSSFNSNLIVDFSTNVNPLATPEFYYQTYIKSLEQIQRYPDSNSTYLKKGLVNYFNNKIKIENLIVGAGSMDLISLFCDMIVNPKDEIIVNQPTFSEYSWAVNKNSGIVINVYRKPENNFKIEVKEILMHISPKTKAIFICNPNNPNGALDNSINLKNIIEFASKKEILVFLDESFIEFARESNSFVYNIATFDNLFVCRSFSKFFGLTGFRIGYGVSSPELIEFLTKGQNLWSVNCIGQNVALEMLNSKYFVNKSLEFFSKEKEFLMTELRKINTLNIFSTDTNFILIDVKNTGYNANQIKKLLIENNILIRNCSNFDGLNEYYIRISIKTRDLNIRLINNLKKIFNY